MSKERKKQLIADLRGVLGYLYRMTTEQQQENDGLREQIAQLQKDVRAAEAKADACRETYEQKVEELRKEYQRLLDEKDQAMTQRSESLDRSIERVTKMRSDLTLQLAQAARNEHNNEEAWKKKNAELTGKLDKLNIDRGKFDEKQNDWNLKKTATEEKAKLYEEKCTELRDREKDIQSLKDRIKELEEDNGKKAKRIRELKEK